MEKLHNINIERAILSSIIFNPESFDELASSLKSEDFYLPFHRYLYEAMEILEQQDLPIDEDFLKKELSNKKRFNENEMMEVLTTSPLSNINAYIDDLKDKSIKRKLNHLSATIRDIVLEDDDANLLIDKVQQGLYKITQEAIVKDFREAKEMVLATLEHIKEMKERENSGVVGLDTGYGEINKLTSGFGNGELIIIAARPAMGKCLGKGTKILMYSGELKKVENIEVGELLMGDDSTPRKVLSLARGREKMYWIRQNKGVDYRVNESHILSLKKSRNERKHKHGDILNISVKEYLEKSDKFKSNYKGYKVAVEFEENEFEIEPYFLGLWLGDGKKADVRIASQDRELRKLNLINNKHIPQNFLINSAKNR